MKNILVTGSKGFIGSSLLKNLDPGLYKVHEFNIEDGDIADPECLARFNNLDISQVIHLAGRIYVPDSWDNPHQFYSTNVIGTLNVLEFCRHNNCALTHVSAYLYGQPKELPISEDSIIVPNNPYAHSKYLAENLCTFYYNSFGTKILIIRPFNAFGIGQSSKFLIPTIINQILNDDTIVVNDLLPRRDYIYLEDLVTALIQTLSCKIEFGTYNIGSGYSLSVQEIIDHIQTVFKSDKIVICRNEKRISEINDVYADISRARSDLAWKPEYSFAQGIEQIYAESLKK